MKKIHIGVIGCGMISEIYLQNLTTVFADAVNVVACADIAPEPAQKRAAQFGLRAMEVDALLVDPEIDLVLNLTVPASHYTIAKRALLAGKHTYSEKPLAGTVAEGKELLTLAKEKGLFVTSAPDTFLGAGIQTCLKLIADGAIGTPVGAQGFMLARGPESFHPNPAFFYAKGAGPLLDMGPYYFTALAALFGPAKRVNGLTRKTFPTRKVLSPNSPLQGNEFPCEVDTYISGGIEFADGVIANVTTTWDLTSAYWESKMPLLTVFGTGGTLEVPDPNTFGGIGASPMAPEPGKFVRLRKSSGEFEEVPLIPGFARNSRGLGVTDMARCIAEGGQPRVSGELSLHVLEMMLGVLEASHTNRQQELETTCTQPAALDYEAFKHG